MSKSRIRSLLRLRLPFFRIFYSSTYTALLLVALFLLCVTPGDHIYQIISAHRIGNLFVVGAAYFVTAVVALFIYASRLYTNRATLAAIPRSYLPIGKGEVSHNVRRLIVKNRQRSALVAWESRPRDLHTDKSPSSSSHELEAAAKVGAGNLTRLTTRQQKEQQLQQSSGGPRDALIPISSTAPPWGDIAHPGWSSPCTPDLPNVDFSVIIAELPNLLEAKAVSLAPPDPAFAFLGSSLQDSANTNTNIAGGSIMSRPPDPAAVAFLQRPPAVGLREYLAHLGTAGLLAGLLHKPDTVSDFLARYEHARFADEALSEAQFRALAGTFAEVLSGIGPTAGEGVGDGNELMAVMRRIVEEGQRTPLSSSSSSSSAAGSVRRYRPAGTAANTPTAGIARRGSIAESHASSETGSIVRHSLATDRSLPR